MHCEESEGLLPQSVPCQIQMIEYQPLGFFHIVKNLSSIFSLMSFKYITLLKSYQIYNNPTAIIGKIKEV